MVSFLPADIAKILQRDSLLTLFLPCGSAAGTLAYYATGQSIGHHFKCIKFPFLSTRSFLEVQWPGHGVDRAPHLALRLKKD
jgi:hypothetical protein